MSNICNFDIILKIECNLQLSPETTELRLWMNLKEMKQMCICEEQDFKM